MTADRTTRTRDFLLAIIAANLLWSNASHLFTATPARAQWSPPGGVMPVRIINEQGVYVRAYPGETFFPSQTVACEGANAERRCWIRARPN